MKKSKLWSGFASASSALLVVGLVGQNLALANASYINSALGATTTRIVQTGEAGDTTYFKSRFGAFDDPEAQAAAIAAAMEQNVNEMREGAALLRNENNTLPLTNATRISVFGHAAVDPAYQANAAGTKVKTGDYNVIDLKAALEAAGFEVNPGLWSGIAAGTATRAQGPEATWGGGYTVTGTATRTEENKAFYEALAGTWADDYKDAAIVVLAREGGEGVDLMMDDVDTDGSTLSALALHKDERDLLEMVRRDFDKVIVLLNSPYQMEVHEIIPYADSILFIGYPGHQGFTGVAEILKGDVNPSGHLADTYATDSLSAPAVVNSGTRTPPFSNAEAIVAAIDQDENAEYMSFQAEGIYIGYRYYETRYADVVMGQGNAAAPVGALEGAAAWNYADEVQYPFGYGLSYTTFDQTLDSVDVGEDTITAKVTVTNTGDVAGKSVVQLYAQTPYGDYERTHGVEKSAVQLAGFAKTGELQPGASETVTVTTDKYLLASYDMTAHNGEGGYILSEGDYYLAIGDDAHDALNNVLAAEGYTTGNGMTADGDAANDAYKFRELAKQEPRLVGDFVWAGMDYLGEVMVGSWEYADYAETFDGGLGWVSAGSGRIDLTGKPLGEALYTRVALEIDNGPYIAVCPVNHTGDRHSPSAWKMTNAMPGWSWTSCEGRKANVEVYARAARVELVLNGHTVGSKTLKNDCLARFSIPYESGTLEAVSYDAADHEIGRCKLQSAGGTTRLTLDAEEPAAKPRHLCYVRLRYTDENGITKPLARGNIQGQVRGGTLVGLGSACPFNKHSYLDSETDTYYGEALAIVRMGDGDAMSIVASDGEYSAELTVSAQA